MIPEVYTASVSLHNHTSHSKASRDACYVSSEIEKRPIAVCMIFLQLTISRQSLHSEEAVRTGRFPI